VTGNALCIGCAYVGAKGDRGGDPLVAGIESPGNRGLLFSGRIPPPIIYRLSSHGILRILILRLLLAPRRAAGEHRHGRGLRQGPDPARDRGPRPTRPCAATTSHRAPTEHDHHHPVLERKARHRGLEPRRQWPSSSSTRRPRTRATSPCAATTRCGSGCRAWSGSSKVPPTMMHSSWQARIHLQRHHQGRLHRPKTTSTSCRIRSRGRPHGLQDPGRPEARCPGGVGQGAVLGGGLSGDEVVGLREGGQQRARRSSSAPSCSSRRQAPRRPPGSGAPGMPARPRSRARGPCCSTGTSSSTSAFADSFFNLARLQKGVK